jgi:hypothetical protein
MGFCLQDNVDPTVLFCGEAAIEAAVRYVLSKAGGCGHILKLGHLTCAAAVLFTCRAQCGLRRTILACRHATAVISAPHAVQRLTNAIAAAAAVFVGQR